MFVVNSLWHVLYKTLELLTQTCQRNKIKEFTVNTDSLKEGIFLTTE